jgi:hypothetical protein
VDTRAIGLQVAQHLIDALGSLGAEHGRMHPSDIARHRHVPDNIRWGDSKVLQLPIVPPAGVGVLVQSSQVVRVDYYKPTSWALALVADFADGLAGEAGTFGLEFQVILGVGSSSVTLKRDAAVTAAFLAANANQVAIILTSLPAKSISIGASILVPSPAVAAHQPVLTALACPLVE